jgi:Flp pilus assembly protein TadD
MLVVELFGAGPGPHHLANVALHVLCSVLLFVLLRAATGFPLRSAFVAALFGLHPLHVESVAWIAERKDVLSTAFWLATMLAWLAWVRGGRLRSYLVALLLFTLGLMSKSMLVTLPCVLLLMDVWPLRRWRGVRVGSDEARTARELLVEKAPLFVLALAFVAITVLAQSRAGAIVPGEAHGLGERSANALVAVAVYLRQTFWPSGLTVFYPYPERLSVLAVLASGLLLAAVSAGAIALRRRAPWWLFGWLWFLGTLLPVLGFVRVGGQAHADRYTYVPHIGLFVAVVFGIAAWLGSRRVGRAVACALGLATLALCFHLTRAQTARWRDDMTLFGHAVAVNAENYVAHEKLGGALYREGRLEEAIRHFEEAIRICPGHAAAHVNLGHVLFSLQRVAEAEASFREALRYVPGDPDALSNLGTVLSMQGRAAEGIPLLQEALRIAPEHVDAHQNLATSLSNQGRLEEALHHYSRALALRPGHAMAARGIAWIRATSIDPSLRDGEEAVRLARLADDATGNGDAPTVHVLAAAQARAGRFDEAVQTASRAAELAERAGEHELAEKFRASAELFRTGRALAIR